MHLENPGLSQRTASALSVLSATREGISSDQETKGLEIIIRYYLKNLKMWTEVQHKPLVWVEILVWEVELNLNLLLQWVDLHRAFQQHS